MTASRRCQVFSVFQANLPGDLTDSPAAPVGSVFLVHPVRMLDGGGE